MSEDVVVEQPNESSAIDELLVDRDVPNEQAETEKLDVVDEGTELAEPEEGSSPHEHHHDEPEDDDTYEEDERDLEIKKLQKALHDSQKWGHSNQKKLKSAQKYAEELKEQGIVTDDEFGALSEALKHEYQEEQVQTPQDQSQLRNILNVANSKINDLTEIYGDDEDFKEKVECFDLMLRDSSHEEVESVLEDLQGLQGNPLKLAKTMYKLGEEYYENVYRDLHEAGGVKWYSSHMKKKLSEAHKSIDKLKKRLSQYEDYDKSNYRIDSLGETQAVPQKAADTLNLLFDSRDKVGNRR